MTFLSEPEAYELLKVSGISVMPYAFATNVEEAMKKAEEIGYPVVMKIVSPDIVHKSDAGGVMVGLQDDEQIKTAYQRIMENAERAVPGGKHQGVLITPMVKGGVETIIGLGTDPEFGKFIMFGLGGIFVELYKDVSFRMIPITPNDARDLIDEVSGSALFKGYRGDKSRNISPLVDLIVSCSRLLESHNEIEEMDLNPVIIREDGALILDARILTC